MCLFLDACLNLDRVLFVDRLKANPISINQICDSECGVISPKFV